MAKAQLRDLMVRDHGQVALAHVKWCHKYNSIDDSLSDWTHGPVKISSTGELILEDNVIIPNLRKCQLQLFSRPHLVKITDIENTKVFIEAVETEFWSLLAGLMVWQNLRPKGINNKHTTNRFLSQEARVKADDPLVCRFKVYGPSPKNKKVGLQEEPKSPIYQAARGEKEGWFNAMGILRPDGMLDLLCETDGSLLYTVDVTKLFGSEIRQLHQTVFQHPNILFLGQINGLRSSYRYANETDTDDHAPFILKNNQRFSSQKRVLILFELGIDLEDWFVALKSFTKLEFLGNQFTETRLRPDKTYSLEVVEASFSDKAQVHEKLNVYLEVDLWEAPWFRTAIVPNTNKTPFWKEPIDLELPPVVESVTLLLKSSNNPTVYNNMETDPTIGWVSVTSDILNNPQNMVKVPLHDKDGHELGYVTLSSDPSECRVLTGQDFTKFEDALEQFEIGELLDFLTPYLKPNNIDGWSRMLLDVYQSLHLEKMYIDNLLSLELKSFRHSSNFDPDAKNPYNTLFRNSSLFSKTLEVYQIRIGQEYLEKMLGGFIAKVCQEGLVCDPDPKKYRDSHVKNYNALLGYLEELWDRIYSTSNDIPEQLKDEWKRLRDKVEATTGVSDQNVALNAVCSFVFLRYICPAILNPKLFNLSQNHQLGRVSVSLRLISKVLMALANRTKMVSYKDPTLMGLNEDFLDRHEDEMLTFYDRITGRRPDPTPNALEMTNTMERPTLQVSSEISNDLPSMPFLIDKYLMFSRLAFLLDSKAGDREQVEPIKRKSVSAEFDQDDDDFESSDFIKIQVNQEMDRVSHSASEKLTVSLENLLHEASLVASKTRAMEGKVSQNESPAMMTTKSYAQFVDQLLKSVTLDHQHQIIYDLAARENGSLDNFFISTKKQSSQPRSRASTMRLPRSLSIQSNLTTKTSAESTSSSKSSLKNLFRRKSLI